MSSSKNIRIECFKKTSDDWYGNFKIADDVRHKDKKYVHVSLLSLGPDAIYGHRVCVWGNDDCGMEKDFIEEFTESQAWELYMDLCCQSVITKDYLISRGFVHA